MTPAATADVPRRATASKTVSYHFSSAFDSGNGELVSATPDTLTVAMRAEPFTEADGRAHIQWFHFRVVGAEGENLRVIISNAGEASYPDGWRGYEACVSTDRKTWRRVRSTSYDEAKGELVVDFGAEPGGVPGNCVYLAYFPPYSNEAHLDLVARATSGDVRLGAASQASHRARLIVLGATNDGRPLDCLVFGGGNDDVGEGAVFKPEPRFAGASEMDAEAARALLDDASPWERDGGAKRVIWVIARQHPGETMASWWMEGFVARLLDEEDPVAKKLLRRAVVHVVPNMNPDGSARGHLRTNALGANLNREWADPRVDYSPEVFHVRNAMDDTGVNLMLDVHGDEAEPYCFIVGGEGTPGWDETRAATQRRFKEAYARACPDFQTVFPLEYGSAPAGNVVTAKTQVVVRFTGALGMTLEMPFKDNAQLAQKDGWTARRSAMLGAAALDAMLDVLPLLQSGE